MKALLGVSEREVHLWENALHLSEEYRQRGNLEIASGGGIIQSAQGAINFTTETSPLDIFKASPGHTWSMRST